MGDRAQIIIERDDTKIYLYTHWNGYKLPATLCSGLTRGKNRWSDSSYLTRIIFCHMLEKDELHDETGFGISTQYQDSMPETDLIVNVDKQTVQYLMLVWSFAEFVKLGPRQWDNLTGEHGSI